MIRRAPAAMRAYPNRAWICSKGLAHMGYIGGGHTFDEIIKACSCALIPQPVMMMLYVTRGRQVRKDAMLT